MKQQLVVLALAAAAFSSFAADGVWKYDAAKGTSPLNPAEWSDPSNWENGQVPTGTGGAVADLSTASDRYIRLDDALTFKQVKGYSGHRPVIFGDGALTITGTGSQTACASSSLALYVPVTLTGTRGNAWERFHDNWMAADITIQANDGMQNPYGNMYFRYDLYANAAGPVRTGGFTMTAGKPFYAHYNNIDFYAPRSLGSAASSTWRLTKDSPFATPVGASGHELPVGTLVTSGDLLAEGTFLKRIFPDGTIELSSSAADTVEATLEFAAFTPDFTLSLPGAGRSVGGYVPFTANKSRAEDVFRIEVGGVWGSSNPTCFSHVDGYQAGTFVLKSATASTVIVCVRDGRIEFAGKDAVGTDAGIPNGTLEQGTGNDAATRSGTCAVVVTNGVVATVKKLTNVYGRFVKEGAGMLVTGLDAVSKLTGTIVVKEGVLAFAAADDGAMPTAPNVKVEAGATLKLSPEGLRISDSVTFAEGAQVVGPGVLVVPDGVDRSTIPADASVQVLSAAQVEGVDPGDYSWDEIPAATSPLDDGLPVPASWMDASVATSLVTTEEAAQLSLLTWKDVRGDGYPCATHASETKFAQVVTNALGQPHHVYIKPEDTTVQSSTRSLNYSPAIPKVKAIFKVFNGAGAIICAQNYRWLRPYPSYGTKLFYEDAGDKVPGTFYLNGEVRSRYDGCAYGAEKAADKSQFDPEVLEYHFSDTGDRLPTAQRIGYYSGGGDSGRNGQDRICEMILYTNELTFVQRQKICAYLMKKWMHGAEANVDHAAVSNRFVTSFAATGDGTAYPVADGKVGVIDTVAETGALVKTGEGTLYVNDLANTDGALRVAAGTAKVRSAKLAADSLPGDPYLHFDATDENSREFVAGSTTKLVRWKDVRGAGYPTGELVAAGKNPTLVADAQNGLPMVDFGSGVWDTDDVSKLTGFRYPETDRLYAIFRIAGGQGGGLISSYAGQKLGPNADGVLHSIPRKEGGMNWFNSHEWVTASEVPGFALLQNQGTVHSPGATWFRLDGADCAAASSYHPQNSVQLMVLNGYDHIVSDTLGCNYGAQAYTKYRGGNCRDGEVIIYTNTLSGASMKKVEAYLAQKWFGHETPGCRPASTGALAVDAGATLELVGGAPISATSFSCVGTVKGAVALEDGAELTLVVNEDGSVAALDVSGGVDFSKGGTVRLTGAVRSLAKGAHVVVDAIGEGFGDWTVVAEGLRKGWTCSFGLVGGEATLTAVAPGMILLVR